MNDIILHTNEDILYRVHFVNHLFDKLSKTNPLGRLCRDRKLFIVVDDNVNRIYGDSIRAFFNSCGSQYRLMTLNATEHNKTMSTVTHICLEAKQFGLERRSVFIAIGGGITMDLVGLAAFLYRRKIPYIRVPTTLIGIVDAGVGVKVGVNFSDSKNFLGGYYAPQAVFTDESFLKTLSSQNMRCGLFEILKMAIIKDRKLYNDLSVYNQLFISKKFNHHTHMINYRSAELMMRELETNLHERNLKRLVDFGHTFSSSIEVRTEYKIPHGEAVGVDMLISAVISHTRKLLSDDDLNSLLALYRSIGFSQRHHLPSSYILYKDLEETRKHRAHNLNLVLPLRIGSAIFTDKCTEKEISVR